ncbi:SPOR domain-containing protein [Pseudomonas sp. N040]|uniref:SPOR domain-containing protein n=1 Tax=Pseudomonas sp. N040 TaxID=2785325 RepID=UPI0018A26129|nr:SPOR domain-containing protein [Pseudomonas sp. N040]MBF7729895.1 SPOR domain-containing protein [Pseudomonas sp. N040]MBW7013537.1 SPOR domain-containing protein [Pseudomonas sp. N040]
MATRKKTATPRRGASRYQPPPRKPVPGWVWMACGLLVGGFIVFLMQLQPGREEIKRDKAEQAVSRQPKTEVSAAKKSEPQKPKYDFYTLLPESEVIVPPDALTAEKPASKPLTPAEAAKLDAARAEALLNGQTPPAPPTVAKAPVTTEFFLQAGSFRKREDADKVRAQIIMLGQNVQVESGTVREEVWHRVLVGPFANREQLAQAQKSLAASGFGNLLLQQRQSR